VQKMKSGHNRLENIIIIFIIRVLNLGFLLKSKSIKVQKFSAAEFLKMLNVFLSLLSDLFSDELGHRDTVVEASARVVPDLLDNFQLQEVSLIVVFVNVSELSLSHLIDERPLGIQRSLAESVFNHFGFAVGGKDELEEKSLVLGVLVIIDIHL
jgi:hypothetical protein